MLFPTLISAASALLFAVLTYKPYQAHLKLHGQGADEQGDLNLDRCQSFFPKTVNTPDFRAGPTFCEDVVLHRQTGVAYLSCDPSRLTWDARAGVWDEKQSDSPDERVGAIWSWDTTQDRRAPRKMFISFPPVGVEPQAPEDLRTSFHPLGIAVSVAHPHFLPDNLLKAGRGDTDVPALVVLVANHPKARASGVVDVFVHDLDGFVGKDNPVLRWVRRIEGDELKGIREGGQAPSREINPFRIIAFEEQYSVERPRAYPVPSHAHNESDPADQQDPTEHAKAHVRIPSFLLTSLPIHEPRSGTIASRGPDRDASAVFRSYTDYVLSVLKPHRSKTLPDPVSRVWLHHASVSKTMPLHMDGGALEAWRGLPPLVQAFDGHGEIGGSNSSASSLFLARVDANRAGVSEWEQHWVRGIGFGIKTHELPTAAEGSSSSSVPRRAINTYTPAFVSFWKKQLDYPLRALALDALGRIWTAGNPETRTVEAWIEAQRNEKRRQLGSSAYRGPSPSAAANSKRSTEFASHPIRPALRIDQTTFLYRQLGQTSIHPWEIPRLAQLKKLGIFARKEFHSLPIFRQGRETNSEVEAHTQETIRERGFLPSVVTGMAVDHERGWVLVAGAYEERGVAKCSIPVGWAEK